MPFQKQLKHHQLLQYAVFQFHHSSLEAIAIPNAAEIEVELCPTPNVSYSLSPRFGKPEIPPNCLLV